MTSLASHMDPLEELLVRASAVRDLGHPSVISYSRKVFIPLSRLCRDVCHYCTFATTPSRLPQPYLSPEQVLAIARSGQASGCTEALFTLGDKPELRYEAARLWLDQHGYASTAQYLAAMCKLVAEETGLLPHVNAGVMTRADVLELREVSASQGLMLESSSRRLCERGGAHHGSPDKDPEVRIEMLKTLGECQVPTTTGILVGIGETWDDRRQSLNVIRDLHAQYGHIQEVIVQNFCPKPGTLMSESVGPEFEDFVRTIAMARLILGPAMNIQAPPNLSRSGHQQIIQAGINDWGGISPVTIDHVNPEAPWPEIAALSAVTTAAGKNLVARLPIYPAYLAEPTRWLSPFIAKLSLRSADCGGLAREGAWSAGRATTVPRLVTQGASPLMAHISDIERMARDGEVASEAAVARLFEARGSDLAAIINLANVLRQEAAGDIVRYVVNRNINYTNICSYGCTFCAFSKGGPRALAGQAYDLSIDEIQRRTREAWDRGATEVCLQGGIHPSYTGATYLEICRAVKAAAPEIHVHAFSPLEVVHGATTLGLSLATFLEHLRDAGLGSLPGTAAEILDDGVRKIICPDKIDVATWTDVISTAHQVGLKTTSTMMFGSVEGYSHWARHLLKIREIQSRTGGITEFVPLPFIADESPMYRKGRARLGPTYREAILVHAVARIVFHHLIPNIQASWVKLGKDGVSDCLAAGANDLGGTLMNESISRAAGAQHGQELPPAEMRAWIESAGRQAAQRTTTYGVATNERMAAADCAMALSPIVLTPPKRRSYPILEESVHV